MSAYDHWTVEPMASRRVAILREAGYGVIVWRLQLGDPYAPAFGTYRRIYPRRDQVDELEMTKAEAYRVLHSELYRERTMRQNHLRDDQGRAEKVAAIDRALACLTILYNPAEEEPRQPALLEE